MIREISLLESLVFSQLKMVISNIYHDLECEEYLGYNFWLNQFYIKFRKAKVTPKKIGQFVTLWKRNTAGITEPFNVNDHFDVCIIITEHNQNAGFFVFPKSILIEKGILSTSTRDGKRGFRVYPDWDSPDNKQAGKTQNWQTKYFIDNNKIDIGKFEKILKC